MSTNNNQYGKEVKPIWKNSTAETQKIMKLSGAKLQSMVFNDLAACTALTLSNRGITKLEDLVGFGDLLHRVDLSGNSITRLQGFNSTPGISMLNISSNEIAGDASLEDLRYLTELRTLNIGNNTNIKYIRSHVAKPLQKLQALIAHECGFEKISFLKFIPNLNTLILSKNSISDFSVSEVGSFSHLTKLSIGHNMLKAIPDLSASVNLTELRIGHNLITSISDSILHNKKLKTLDISHNLLTDWEDVKMLVGLPNLTNLGLKDNNFPPPSESTDDLEVREDKAAEGIEDVIERRFRRYVLSMFLRVVGVAGKTFEQLIVLDMKRVKMKLSPGMGGEIIVDDRENKGEETIKKDDTKKNKDGNKKKTEKMNPAEREKSEKIKVKKSKEIDVKPTEITAVKELKSSKRDSKKRSPEEEVETIVSSDSKIVVEKKKRKTIETDGGGFLDSNDNGKSFDRNELKSVKVMSGIPTSSSGSGVVSVVDHKKTMKGDSIKNKTNKEISSSIISHIPVDGKSGNIKINNGTKKNTVITDDVSVSAVLLGNSTFIVGSGGNSSWSGISWQDESIVVFYPCMASIVSKLLYINLRKEVEFRRIDCFSDQIILIIDIMSITFITGNKKKISPSQHLNLFFIRLEEVLAILGDSFPYPMVSTSLELPELQGEPEYVASEKCKWASEQVDGPVMVEDTSLCFNALGGLPGVYIKYFLEKTGHEGLNNIISAYPDKSAYAQCIFAYCKGRGQEVVVFVGRTEGTIVPARGPATSFGWDPIFQPDGFLETYAEMDKNIKNTISHRYRALDKLRSYLIESAKN